MAEAVCLSNLASAAAYPGAGGPRYAGCWDISKRFRTGQCGVAGRTTGHRRLAARRQVRGIKATDKSRQGLVGVQECISRRPLHSAGSGHGDADRHDGCTKSDADERALSEAFGDCGNFYHRGCDRLVIFAESFRSFGGENWDLAPRYYFRAAVPVASLINASSRRQ
jgi:hypothetical protein